MFSRIWFCVLTLCGTCYSVSIPGVKTSESFNNSKILDVDGNFILFWNFNETHITFETHVRTKGWVGLGLSANGQMFPGDVAVGWVLSDGTTKFTDRHTTGHSMPVLDSSQDWHLLFAEENEFGTVLKMVRKLKSCDRTDDSDILEGTNRIIYAYGDHDPTGDDIFYHGSTRGTKSVILLRANAQKNDLGHVMHWDFLQSNVIVPSDTTTYWCRGFNMPPIGKHHMIKYEPVITPGNEMNVHHILLYRCKVAHPERYDGVSENCYSHHRTLPGCSDIIAAWAIGGEPFYFPDHVGFSFGGPDDDSYFVMETHYDNPTMKSDIIDDSGLRITLTSNLRQHDAGLLEIGVVVNHFQIVPPGLPDFVSKGYCHEQCLDVGFNQANLSQINVFGAMQHSHLLGVAITTKHYRNGQELKPLIDDPHYDFDFQEIRVLPKEVPVYPGDSFRVECHYDSTERTGPTLGGLSTQEEMCLTFAYYYPRLPVSTCLSLSTYDYLQIDTSKLMQYVNSVDWNNQTIIDLYKEGLEKSHVYQVCEGNKLKRPDPEPSHVYLPTEPKQHYTPPLPDCS